MKAYTDLEQSKKLAEILPIESADMVYIKHASSDNPTWRFDNDMPPMVLSNTPIDEITVETLPCWSLAALLEEIPSTIVNNVGEDLKLHIDKDNLQYSLFYENEYTGDMFEIETELYDDMIDACYEMILKLHDKNLI